MNSALPPLSVIIPVHNREGGLWRAVRSVIVQGVDDVEIIVVDDGSNPPVTIPSDLADDSRIRVLRHATNKGPAAGRNTGLRAATGEWLAFLDSDDAWIPGTLALRLSLAYEASRQKPDALAVYASSWRDINPQGRTVRVRRPRAASRPEDFAGGCWFAPGSAVLFRREPVMAAVGFQDECLLRLEDFDWFMRLAGQGATLVCQDVVGVDIACGGIPSYWPQLNASIDYLGRKWLGRSDLTPEWRHRLAANLHLELARAALFQRQYLRFALMMARSWLRYPRFSLQVNPGWEIKPAGWRGRQDCYKPASSAEFLKGRPQDV
jgi:glycosyltransferase involved in cell wall biosynthesis